VEALPKLRLTELYGNQSETLNLFKVQTARQVWFFGSEKVSELVSENPKYTRYPKTYPKSESIRRMGKQSDIRKYPNPKVIRIRLLRMGKQSHEVRSGGVYFLQSTSFSS